MNYLLVSLKYIYMRTADSKVDPKDDDAKPPSPPRDFRCPISLELISDPSVASKFQFQRPDVRLRVHHAVVRLRQVHMPKDRASAGGFRACAQQGAQELDRAVVPGERHHREAGR